MIRLHVELQEMVYQQRDVLAPFAQFGHANVDYVKAVVEVFSKLPFAHRLDNILIGGRNHSHINLFIFAPADLANHSFLQDAQQLTSTKGLDARALLRWIDRATISLPVPVRPLMSTVALVGATRSMIR